jgi:hypothetical protein
MALGDLGAHIALQRRHMHRLVHEGVGALAIFATSSNGAVSSENAIERSLKSKTVT